MEITAAAAFVASFLIGNGLYATVKDNLWIVMLFMGCQIGTAVWLAAAANLWPFYVLGGVYGMVLVIVIVLSIISGYSDGKEASTNV